MAIPIQPRRSDHFSGELNFRPRGNLHAGEEYSPAHKVAGVAGLQQLDRGDFQRIALHVPADVHAQVVLLVRGLESFHDLCVSLGIELQVVLVFWIVRPGYNKPRTWPLLCRWFCPWQPFTDC